MTALRTKPRRRRRANEGDVHVGTMSGDVPPVPGSTSEGGRQALDAMVAQLLAEVRRHIRIRKVERDRR